MKKLLKISGLSAAFLALVAIGTSTASADYNKIPATVPNGFSKVYRLYNPNTGEHFYTTGSYERSSLISKGWNDEGIGWYAPTSGSPVYRLYNPNAKGGDHYYTESSYERNSLVQKGWKAENTGWYSGGTLDVYVAFNPNAQSGAHNYTTGWDEQSSLLTHGWKYGSTAWKAVDPWDVTTGMGKLPAVKAGAQKTAFDLDTEINRLRVFVMAKADAPIGSRAIDFQNMGANNGEFQSGCYSPGQKIKATTYGLNGESDQISWVDSETLSQYYTSSFYPVDSSDGAGNVTALLTAKGWYLLPDYQVNTNPNNAVNNQKLPVKIPDYAKFIKTGNIADLTSYTDGTRLELNPTDQFGEPVLIS